MSNQNKFQRMARDLLLATLEEDVVHCRWSQDDFESVPPTPEAVDQRARHFDPTRGAYLQQELAFWIDEEAEDGGEDEIVFVGKPQTPLQAATQLLNELKAEAESLVWADLYGYLCRMYPQARRLLARNLAKELQALPDDREFIESYLLKEVPFHSCV